MDLLLNDTSSFMNLVLGHVQSKVNNIIKEVDETELTLDEVFTDLEILTPFHGTIDTEYLQTMFFALNFGLVVSDINICT